MFPPLYSIGSIPVLEVTKSLSAIMCSFFTNENVLKSICGLVYSNEFVSALKFTPPVYLFCHTNTPTDSHIIIHIHKYTHSYNAFAHVLL